MWNSLLLAKHGVGHLSLGSSHDRILLALFRTVPNAVALGNRAGTAAEQSRLARAICADHLVCLVLMSAFLVVWLVAARMPVM